MRAIIQLSKQSMRHWSFISFHLKQNRFLVNRSDLINKCMYSTATETLKSGTDSLISPPPASPEDKQYPPKIQKIVSDISNLTLIEVSELNELLKKTLKIVDTPMMSMSAMPMAAAPAQQEEEEEDIGAKTVQTSFTLKLNKFDETKKVALIKQIKTIVEGMNLVQAKKFVESVPQVIKSNLPKDEAEKLKTAIEAVGGICLIE